MNSILDALQEGRLFELPDNDKVHALQFLAHIIEAFPEIPPGTDVEGYVMKREAAHNTALGKGWACPHARVPFDEDLMCVIGWSPQGIDYDAPDGQPVRIVVMYLIPDNQRNNYLREISLLAKALETYPSNHRLQEVTDLNEVRNYLLDLIDVLKDSVGPDSRARMIRLQAKTSQESFPYGDLTNLIIEPLTIISAPNAKPVILTQHKELFEFLGSTNDLINKLENEGFYQKAPWRIVRRCSVKYQMGHTAYDCLAIRMISSSSDPQKSATATPSR
ncbi:MAG: PTS sugar transporter subunit IIA [Candidatus Hydrogenedentota bacterium]|nr:MAG: PTS sugar transporter subunit IIA [Candidatus Hydrogenedentota bacterium]